MLGLMHSSCSPATQYWHWEQVSFGVDDDPVAHPDPRHLRTDLYDVPGGVATQDVGLVQVRAGCPGPRAS